MNIISSSELIVALLWNLHISTARHRDLRMLRRFGFFCFWKVSSTVANVKHCIVDQSHVLLPPCWIMLFVDLNAAWARSWCLLVTWDYLSNTTVNYSRPKLIQLVKTSSLSQLPVSVLGFTFGMLLSDIVCIQQQSRSSELIRTYRTYFLGTVKQPLFRLIL
jgi:hypothetical protein